MQQYYILQKQKPRQAIGNILTLTNGALPKAYFYKMAYEIFLRGDTSFVALPAPDKSIAVFIARQFKSIAQECQADLIWYDKKKNQNVFYGSHESVLLAINTIKQRTVYARLLLTLRRTCTIMSPFIRLCYAAISSETSKLKEDKSIFTIADGVVQTLLMYLLDGRFKHCVGEENAAVNLTAHVIQGIQPYSVDGLIIPVEFLAVLNGIIEKITVLRSEIDSQAFTNDCVFIDPIDGTREFASGKGEQCTICIGISNGKTGRHIAGLIFRPLNETYAMGATGEGFYKDNLVHAGSPRPGLLVSNGTVSDFLLNFTEEMKKKYPDFALVRSGGAGNKTLLLLAGYGTIYLQDRGLSRWDTCAAEAILSATKTGSVGMLEPFLRQRKITHYTYRFSRLNTNFKAGIAKLTPFNSSVPEASGVAFDIRQVKPYANMRGFIALADKAQKNTVWSACQGMPSYD